MKVLILGASGMLGHKLCQELPKYGHEVSGTVRRDLDPNLLPSLYGKISVLSGVDATRQETVEQAILESDAEFIVNAIGVIKQRKEASIRKSLALINSYFPHFLADLALRTGKRLIHISTDCVFNGQKGAYTESDIPTPEDPYGQSKMLGETEAEEEAALTIRTSIIGRELGPGAYGLLEWLFSKKGGTVKGFTKAIFTGLTTLELSKAIHMAIEHGNGLNGIVHVSSQKISKMDLLTAINEEFSLGITVEPDDVQGICDRSLLMNRFSRHTGYKTPSWKEMISALKLDPTPYEVIRQ
jgi:dTDP-4-dehydrorhamnose reductase